MIPVLTPAESRALDAAASEPFDELVARAGWAVAVAARDLLGATYGRRVVVAAGPGANGADGRVAARWLRRWGARVDVVDGAARVCHPIFSGLEGSPYSGVFLKDYEVAPW